MKKTIKILIAAVLALPFIGCDKWTEVEILGGYDPTEGGSFSERHEMADDLDKYWHNIREYKKSDHAISYGWYSSWNPPANDNFGSGSGSLTGLPDSMDMVALWLYEGNLTTDINETQKRDLDMARNERGLKVLFCHMCNYIGQYICPGPGADYTNESQRRQYWDNLAREQWKADEIGWGEASYQYGLAFGKWILDSGYDGLDLDYEPNFGHTGNLQESTTNMQRFIEGLAEYLGPNARGEGETVFSHGKVLMVDGEPQTLNSVCGRLLDYYNIQAYYCSGDSNLDTRFNNLINKYGPNSVCGETVEEIHRKIIWCEDFENVSYRDGGANFTKRGSGGQCKSLYGMSTWHYPGCENARIGGAGAFKFNLVYERVPENSRYGYWHYMRESIQAMNPAQLVSDDEETGEEPEEEAEEEQA